MRKSVFGPLFVVALIAGVFAEIGVAADQVKAVTYSPHAAYPSCLMNMGPTGARAWMRGYHLVVVEIAFASPAAGRLAPSDVVIAADGTTFGAQHDPRMTLGNAIGRAEADGEPLVLTVLRDGKKKAVKLLLPPTADWTGGWGPACEKSREVLFDACQSLLNAQMPNGQIITDGNMGTTLGGLLMLANPDPRFLDGARRAAYQVVAAEYNYGDTCNNWALGYGGLLLAEYYLATGDAVVLPRLKDMVDIMSRGQMRCGGWGHTSPGGAYGTLNQIGVVCAITLTLAKECGIDVPPQTLNRALDFFARYAEIGAVPYGDHLPYTTSLDANGRSASAAILMHLAGRRHEATSFSSSVAASYFEREEGHTGAFFSMTWGPLGAALAGPAKLQTFMDYQKWYYNLCRTWKGELVLLPYYEALTRFDSSSYIDFGGDFTSGGMGLAFALPYQRLRIMGAPSSVFSPSAKIKGSLLKARDHWVAKEWKACNAVLDGVKPSDLADDRQRQMLTQLVSARTYRQQATDCLLLELGSNLDNQAAYRATFQYDALKKHLGPEAVGRFEAMDKRMEGAASAIDTGKTLFDTWRELRGLSFQGWVPYGPRAKDLIRGFPPLRVPIWEPLSPVSEITPQSWRTLQLGTNELAPTGWMNPEFDDGDWKTSEGIASAVTGAQPFARRTFDVPDPKGDSLRVRLRTVRPAHTRVYLNGELIVDAVRGQRGGYAIIALDASVFGVLKKVGNVLTVSSTSQGSDANQLDVGLEICRASFSTHGGALITDDALVVRGGKDVDNTLRVRETKDRVKQARQDACNRKALSELLPMLGVSVAGHRNMAEIALAAKGAEGIEATAALLGHADWKVRSAACNVMAVAAAAAHKESPDSELMKTVVGQVAALTGLLDDKHTWVQVRAARALSLIGESARACLPALVRLVADDDEWVRTAALEALENVAPDEKTKLEAAMVSLRISNTAFQATRVAHRILVAHPVQGDERLNAIVATLQDPPEGLGGRIIIKPLLEYAVSLDPEGKIMIPLLIEAAADKRDRYSRQQANPRAKMIELLAAYGEKAKGAIPVLQAILESYDPFDKNQHAAAREALQALGVTVEEE
jgi:hypothetical protein